ncbi:MAG TPA: bifunctional lysine ketoglutarate reductase /saccharopine dehydrogenase family protein [Bacteroidota bacterium]|nr:bifunctional lysine ketoglutarate reductase /saccharopine dehydrogenase family protein [Bacteroidota bacterium]
MLHCIGIRKETKDHTERRVPLVPEQVARLHRDHGLRILVEPMENRIFSDEEFRAAGAELTEDLSDANIIIGVKEIHPRYMLDDKAYLFFSHTIKAQSYNMGMLRHMLEHHLTLLDYELIRDERNRRLVFFGNFAGLAGMIDTLWALGKRLDAQGIASPFSRIRYASEYGLLEHAEQGIREVGEVIRRDGLPPALVPFVTGFTGYGNVSKGAQSLYELLPVEHIAAGDLEAFMRGGRFSDRVVYSVEFREEDLVARIDDSSAFDLQEYYTHPERYRGVFDAYLPHLSVLVNGIYWDERFPRLLSLEAARALWAQGMPRLRAIGDISCDIDGSVQLTVKGTTSDNPVYVHDPLTGVVTDGWEGERGPVILAVDKLPTELPREASIAFGMSLEPFIPALARADFSHSFDDIALPPELRRAVIAHKGVLTPDHAHLESHLP